MTTTKAISRLLPSMRAAEGDGMVIHRAFPGSTISEIDPFLLLDEMGPLDLHAGEGKGFPDHPHRGFETVTYLLEGQIEHRDSRGNAGRGHCARRRRSPRVSALGQLAEES